MNKAQNSINGFVIDDQNPIVQVRYSGAYKDYKPQPKLHRHDHYEILIIEKGGGEHIIDYTAHDVVDNQIFFLRPGQVHQFKPSKDAVFYFLAFDTNAIQFNTTIQLGRFEFFQSFNTQGHIVLDTLRPILSVLKSLMEDSDNDNQINQSTLISSYLMILLIKLQREFVSHHSEADSRKSSSPVVRDFNRLIDEPSIKLRFVQDYADSLHVTPNYLNECVKKETGKPVSFWISEKILIEAKRLLNDGRLNITEIAKELNFPDTTHFSRFFKRATGKSPRDFKSSLA